MRSVGRLQPAKDIVEIVARVREVRVADVLSASTCQPEAGVRQEVMYFLRHALDWSFPRVGIYLDRDHSTVMGGVRRVAAQMERDAGYCGEIDEIFTLIELNARPRFIRFVGVRAAPFASVRALAEGRAPP
ncbi:helix-turn-helix domain-containing protein [uncultured Maritimibacter sp.]|jgi:chromosomal replication initiation ATPase DnaA|uniref:helix-turn-helix domain-containing protein n=1 Tax=uncultured Maritimibacter sp. TaxID=991866 RepID=UPI00262AC975|nr:helix-turn-helix domain-containing protein [uncultured Maritimibacter sp.]